MKSRRHLCTTALLLCAALAACTMPKRPPTLEEQAADRIESQAARPTVTIEPAVVSPSRSNSPQPGLLAFVEAPRPLTRPPPRYPRALANDAMPGRVVVSFEVNAEGRAEAVEILQSSHPLFAQAVQAALVQWRFAPARAASGEAVPARLRMPFEFRVDD
ncbi:TonB family protein [Variovorax fucosicus]|uniref:TonB family protein n=1 Tax=Variovorax fucosicus TaxID=3053517 RepID=UPI00257495FB|nr:TonB family protein [Variovorax sp. J22G47]MDM0057089.1 TonB family protein [Variovorax sp. J22G47]